MKTNRAFLFTLATLLCAAAPGWGQTAPFAQTPAIQPRPVPSQPVAVPWHPTGREAHQTTWESISVEEINPITHQRVPRRQRYVEIATGLNRLNRQGQFEAASPAFALQDGGAVAGGGAHFVKLPADIATEYGVETTTPDGVTLKSHPSFLGYFDPTDGRSVILAIVTNCIGTLVASNEVIFSDCFLGLHASIRYRNRLSGLEQDLVINARPADPTAYGLSSASRLELITAFHPDTPAPQKTTRLLQQERDPARRQAMQQPDVTDETLRFGTMTMGPGRAFSTAPTGKGGSGPAASPSAPVAKRFTTLDGHPVLIESVDLERVRPMLQTLPERKDTSALPSAEKNKIKALASFHRTLPAKPLAQAPAHGVIKRTAALDTKAGSVSTFRLSPSTLPFVPAFVIDYELSQSYADAFTFTADTTFYASGPVTFSNTVTFEGGTVIKFNPGESSLRISDNAIVHFATGPYLPAVFTSRDDDSIGIAVDGSTGTPVTSESEDNRYLFLSYAGQPLDLHDVRMSYCYYGLFLQGLPGTQRVRHAQFLQAACAIRADSVGHVTVENVLLSGVGTGLGLSYANCDVAHLTAHLCYALGQDSGNTASLVGLTNCLLVGVETGTNGLATVYDPNNVKIPGPSEAIFQTVGGGSHYLTNDSTYRNAGTIAISPDLRRELATLTTYPPVVYQDTNLAEPLVLCQQAARNTGLPDLGYHYAPLDYAFGGASLWTSMRWLPGTAVAWFETVPGSGFGLSLEDGATLSSEGTEEAPNTFARSSMVQEGGNGNWPYHGWMGGLMGNGTGAEPVPVVSARFTHWTTHANTGCLFRDNWAYYEGNFQDCEFVSGNIGSMMAAPYAFTNSLLDRVYLYMDGGPLSVRNGLHHGGSITLYRWFGQSQPWLIQDTALDNTRIAGYDALGGDTNYTTFAYNAFLNGSDQLSPSAGPNVLTNLTWELGPLGSYYQPDDSPLMDAGSTTADQLGLYHYTTQTSQAKEGSSKVDIGYHYVGTGTTNLALAKPVLQSSTNFPGVPENAVDGNVNGNWFSNSVTHTQLDYRPWWQVDLGASSLIDTIRLWNRQDCCQDRLANFWLLVSDIPFASTDLDTVLNQPGVSAYPEVAAVDRSITFPIHRIVRYVRVQLASPSDYLSLAEVEAFAGNKPLDTDGDGVADYLEDMNGDGLQNIGETDWQIQDSPFLPDYEPMGPCSRRTPLVISEIMLTPTNHQFIEIFNSHHLTQSLDGFEIHLPIGPKYDFPNHAKIAPGTFVKIGLTNALSAAGRIQLKNKSDALLLEINYRSQNPWPVAAWGTGHSMVLAKPSFGEDNPLAWVASEIIGGSPGYGEINKVQQLRCVVINEILGNPTNGQTAYVELYNRSRFPIDVSGAFLSPDSANLFAFQIPNPAIIPAGGFLCFYQGNGQGQLPFTPGASGGSLFFTQPDGSRVADAVVSYPQAAGVAFGRFPNGGKWGQELSSPTPGTANATPRRSEIIINEIMYHPISGKDNEEFIELFNQGTNTVDLSNWSLVGLLNLGHITNFAIPNGTLINAGNFFVIANNRQQLFAHYANLNSSNTVGNYEPSHLPDSSCQLFLLNKDSNLVAQASYADGGRWGNWSDGGGASLELKDARSDANIPSNWADSDPPQHTNWTTVQYTGVLELGDFNTMPDALEVILTGAGEALVDDVNVTVAGQNLVSNPGFEFGLTNWGFEGNHDQSSRMTNGGAANSACLHLRATGGGSYFFNRITNGPLNNLGTGTTATISASVLWLRGNPDIVFRLRGNWLEAAGSMTVPINLGTPGLLNSQAQTNAPPAIYEVTHFPVLPLANKHVLVTARVTDPDGVASVMLKYRCDPNMIWTNVAMLDDGTGGDLVAGDGIYTAAIPGFPVGQMVAYYVQAQDSLGNGSTFPPAAPAKECLVRFGEPQPSGSLAVYRIWFTQPTSTNWSTRGQLHDTPLDITFVYGNSRVIYNAGACWAGSENTSQLYDTPTGLLCGYSLQFPADDRFLGSKDALLDWSPRDSTGQREQLAYWLANEIELPFNYRRFVKLVANGVETQARTNAPDFSTSCAAVYEDVQRPDADFIAEWFPDQAPGDLCKISHLYYGYQLPANLSYLPATLLLYTNSAGMKNVPTYRWTWPRRGGQGSPNDFTALFEWVDAVNFEGLGYIDAVDSVMDWEQCLRILALERSVGNEDSYGFTTGQNMYAYRPSSGAGWNLLLYDTEFDFNLQGCAATDEDVFTNMDDGILRRLVHTNVFQRAYWRAFYDLANDDNGPMQKSKIEPIIDENFAYLNGNGITRTLPAGGLIASNDGMKGWIKGRKKYLREQYTPYRPTFQITSPLNNTMITNQYNIDVTGQAPVEVKYIYLNGTNAPLEWTNITAWKITVGLQLGTNVLTVVGYDRKIKPLGSNDTGTFTNTIKVVSY